MGTDGRSLEGLLERVRGRVTPDEAERAAMAAVTETVVERAEAAVADLPVTADVLRVGSTARDTWVAGDRDVDVFVRFPTTLDRETLERYGLEVGRAVLPDGREEYAEHPYVTGTVDGFDVDLVPCYDVPAATEIRSAVDRTPFHTTYLADRLTDELAGDVRVAKAFLDGIGAYGSDLRTRGFSGYLTELLVLAHDGVRGLLEAAAGWAPPVTYDPAGHAAATFEDPLVVVDPTDPERNVAAVVSAESVARVTHFARELVEADSPDPAVFTPDPRAPMAPAAVRAAVAARETTPVAVRFPAPDLVDDQLYPQLRRSLAGLQRGLEGEGIAVLRGTTFADDERAVLLVEPAVGPLPAVERHEGPPVGVGDHARGFHESYADGPATGPFLDGERYVVERERAVRTAAGFARERLTEVSLGARVADRVAEGYEVLVGAEVGELAPRFGTALTRYLRPTPRG